MIITKLKLNNYRQHRNLELDMTDGKAPFNHIGVIGNNGDGKSHLLHAMEFVLVGKCPGQNKEDMLSWGAEKGFVELWFTHYEKPGYIKRAVHSSSAQFKYGTIDVKGITKVNEQISETLQISPEMAQNGIFVAQASIDSILFDKPAVRERTWQRLVGLVDCDKIHKGMGQYLNALPQPQDYTPQKDMLEQQLVDADVAFKAAAPAVLPEYTLEQVAARIQSNEDELATAGKVTQVIQSIKYANDSCTQADIDLVTRQAILDKALAEVNPELTTEEECQSRIADAQAAIANYNSLQEAYTQYTLIANTTLDLEAELEQAAGAVYDATYAQVSITPEVADNARSVIKDCTGKVAMYNDLLKVLQTDMESIDDKCPLCQQGLTGDHKLTLHATVAKQVTDLSATLQSAAETVATYEREQTSYQDNLVAAETALASVKMNLQTNRAWLDTVPEQHKVQPSLGTAKADLAAGKEMLAKLRASTKAVADAEACIAPYKKVADDAKAALDQHLASYTALTNMPYTVDAITIDASHIPALLTELRQGQALLQQYDAAVKAREVVAAYVREQRALIASKEEADKKMRETLRSLTEVREWFHYANGPHKVAVAVLKRLTPGVNDFLDLFNSDFSVVADVDELGYRVQFHDDRPTPEGGLPSAIELSGGQRIMLALAFRLACYFMFASKFGIMTLDEPTTYLDENNVKNFVGLFELIRDMSNKLGIQMFISTHEKQLIPVMDSTIMVTKEN